MKRQCAELGNSEQTSKRRTSSEVESLYDSNIYRLQVEQLLNEIRLSEDKKSAITNFTAKLKDVLLSMKRDDAEHKIADFSWLKNKNVDLPLSLDGRSWAKGTFRFLAPRKIRVVGSFMQDTCIRRHGNIDIAVEIPQNALFHLGSLLKMGLKCVAFNHHERNYVQHFQDYQCWLWTIEMLREMGAKNECIHEKDHLNQRYLVKRAIYLAYIASHLKQSGFDEQIQYTQMNGCSMKPVLLIKPNVPDLKHITFVIHLCFANESFKLNRFNVTKNNVRPSWYLGVESESAIDDTVVPTPHYNTWILSDMTMQQQNDYLAQIIGNNKNVKDCIMLFKVWLHQRQLDMGFGCVNGFIISMFIAYLLVKQKISASLSSYHFFHKVLIEIVQTNWDTNGISLAPDVQQVNRPVLEDFLALFGCTFVDCTGYVNICSDVNSATYRLLKHEAEVSLSIIDSPNAFQALFMKQVPFVYKYDQTFHVTPSEDWLLEMVDRMKLKTAVMDHCGDYVNVCLPQVFKLLYKALGNRVKLVAAKPEIPRVWEITTPAPTAVQGDSSLWLGLLVDPQASMVAVDLGPNAGTKEAAEFRKFWKEKSELRRFPDGSIREAVVWPADTLADQRMICCRIIRHILCSHVGLSHDSVKFMANQCDSLLRPHLSIASSGDSANKGDVDGKDQSATYEQLAYGLGEEQHSAIIASLDSLTKELHQAVSASSDLPLTINSVHGVDPAFRYTEVFPALPVQHSCKTHRHDGRMFPFVKERSQCPMFLPSLSVVCMLEGSGKWPDDVEAVRRLKAAYYLNLSRSLNKTAENLHTAAYTDHLDVYKDGFVFRITVGYNHEIVLHKKQLLPDGKLKLSESDLSTRLEYLYCVLPRLTSCLHGLHLRHNSFGGAVRLSKRWLASQMLLHDYIAEEAVELLVAFLYVSPEPFTIPGSPLIGFLRFLHLLSTHDWQKDPLIVNINHELSRAEMAEIETKFKKERSTLPAMFVSSPFDKFSQIWTKAKPSGMILQRVVQLAREARLVLEEKLAAGSKKSHFKQVFRTSMSHFDAVIKLNNNVLVRRHCAVDHTLDESYRCTFVKDMKPQQRDVWPVFDYDPVQLYVRELREAFEDIALFFHDHIGGAFIGVVWKPQAVGRDQLKLSHINCRQPVPSSDGKGIEMNLDRNSVLEDFSIIGQGLVADIGVRSSDPNLPLESYLNSAPFTVEGV